ncbi:hypothetical protein B0T20DRAFT_126724 [Sordaria brevicollis]|uniref:Uncharacterized protein n=1 Tax=Sordaria brevicollis TaxID=83679 RepID=A0AAE0PL80_SORBR|nr:hypothetical protein B0T20DRAFT_126724 [Sordaria brevicollis]
MVSVGGHKRNGVAAMLLVMVQGSDLIIYWSSGSKAQVKKGPPFAKSRQSLYPRCVCLGHSKQVLRFRPSNPLLYRPLFVRIQYTLFLQSSHNFAM